MGVAFTLLCASICVCFACANIDSANTSAGFIGAFVCEHYINAHINVLCVHGCLFFSSFASTCVLVCIIHNDYQPSAVCQATEAVSLDCIDLVPPHAVMKNEK